MIRHGVAPFLECSSKGDMRFSAFFARVVLPEKGNRSIEEHYQAFKIFEDGTTNLGWRDAKGKRAINQKEAAVFYAHLWDQYIEQNPELKEVLLQATGLSDMFGQYGHVCQATELWRIKHTLEPL